ncbi:Peptidyl-prolyl cis-trans isomerase CPR1-like [Homarus americanus]|uniref:Peptidyl-prolyl cis-trans isomerase CPR1-like n=1 Tax=Homarus americanus TaxID=6706 RepID=A0A8J5K707_HOMAM|nr:Peptidyl-prolyl cis-trans isomerase CPR1-like [Homarus americanus]
MYEVLVVLVYEVLGIAYVALSWWELESSDDPATSVCWCLLQNGIPRCVCNPLVLPCGHTYCSSCIRRLHHHTLECPGCRTSHKSLNIKQLPVNYALMSLAVTTDMISGYANGRLGRVFVVEVVALGSFRILVGVVMQSRVLFRCESLKVESLARLLPGCESLACLFPLARGCEASPVSYQGRCEEHGDAIRFWCVDCQSEGCGVCMFSMHPKTNHEVKNMHEMVDAKKRIMKDDVKNLIQSVNSAMEEALFFYKRLGAKMLRILKKSCHLHQLVKQVEITSKKIDTVTGMCSLTALLEEFDKIREIATGKFDNLHKEIYTRATDDEDHDNLQAARVISAVTQPLDMHVGKCGGGDSHLMWKDDRLLLCTVCCSTRRQLVQLLAVERLLACDELQVFLEFSVDQVNLGRVYIKLWGHLRRAQHFLALCLGTLGPSFSGTKLLEITSRGSRNESVTAGAYRAPNGSISSKSLMNGLEWDGVYAGERRAGLVVASSGGKVHYDSQFGICTSANASGRVRCPFGEVVSGLDVVRESASYIPINQVGISGCGLVLQ